VIGQNYDGPQYERRRRLESCADHVLHCEQKFFLVASGSTSIDIVTGETPSLRVTLLQQSSCTGNTNFTKLFLPNFTKLWQMNRNKKPINSERSRTWVICQFKPWQLCCTAVGLQKSCLRGFSNIAFRIASYRPIVNCVLHAFCHALVNGNQSVR